MTLTIITGILVVLFLMAGFMKVSTPKAKFQKKMAWAKDFSQDQLKKIGMLEMLGALGLVLPVWLGVLEWLTPLAAIVLGVLTLLAVKLHLKRKEMGSVVFSGAVFILIAYVFWNNKELLGL